MSDLNGQWVVHQIEELFDTFEYFNTKEEAIKFGKQYDEFGDEEFFVSQIEEISISSNDLGIEVVEIIQSRHYDDEGDVAEDYLCDVEQEHIDELSEVLDKVIDEWATKYKYQPDFYNVKNIERIKRSKND